jgi:hypothetical protein
MCHGVFFMETPPGPPELEKWCVNVSRPRAPECTTWPVDPTGWKTLDRRNVSQCPFYRNLVGPNRALKIVHRCFMHQTQRSALRDPWIPLIQKHKFGVTCLDMQFVESIRSYPSMKNNVSMFRTLAASNALCDPHIPQDPKTKVCHNMSWHTFFNNRIGPTWAW